MYQGPAALSGRGGTSCSSVRGEIPSHCVSDTGALGTEMRSSKAQVAQDQTHGQALSSYLNNRKSSRRMAPGWLSTSSPLTPEACSVDYPGVYFQDITDGCALLPPLYPPLILFLFLHLANGRWGEASKGFPPDQRVCLVLCEGTHCLGPWGKNLSLPPRPLFLTEMPGRLPQLRTMNYGGCISPCFQKEI